MMTKRSSMRINKTLKLLLLAGVLPLSAISNADVRTDGSVGAVQSLSGKMLIPQTLGQVKGQNLFHSFSSFSINPGESAIFTTTDQLQNIITRVTGGSVTTIQGLLQVQAADGSKPHFYLINPKGVVFGEGAVIDVPAGLHISTANYLQFPDGQFHADLKASSSLSAANPEAFGFLGGEKAEVRFSGRTKLVEVAQRPLNLVAGDIVIEDTWLKTLGGEIRVIAVGDAKQVVKNGELPDAKGRIVITDGGLIDSSGGDKTRGGNIAVSGGDIQLGSPDLISFNGIASNATETSGAAGNINVRASGKLSIIAGNSISSSTFGAADAGQVNIQAQNLSIEGHNLTSTGIHSNAEDGKGNAGTVNVRVNDTLYIENGGAIASSTFAQGKAGIVNVSAKNIVLDGKGISTGIVSETSSILSDSGDGGAVNVTASEKITILEGASISASSYTAGNRYKAGSAGQLMVQTKDLLIDGLGDSSTGIRSFTASVGNAGSVQVVASGDLTITGGANITTETNFTGSGGNIRLQAKNLSIDGKGDSNTGIYSNVGTQGRGNAGTINLQIDGNLNLQNGAKISSSTDSYGAGSAGSVTITANTMLIKGSTDPEAPRTEIASAAHANEYDLYSSGSAGAVNLSASDSIVLRDGASISSSTYYKGKAGTVQISAPKLSLLNGAIIQSEAGPDSAGQTGNLQLNVSERFLLDHAQLSIKNQANVAQPEKIQTSSLQVKANALVLDHGEISAASSGNVAASQIQIDFGKSLQLSPGLITTSAVSGNGGAISILGNGLMLLKQGQVSTSVSGLENGNGGNISVTAPVLLLQGAAIQANTAAAKASGGDVGIHVNDILSSRNRLIVGGAPVQFDAQTSKWNLIQAAAADGVSGTISLASPPVDVSASLGRLAPQLIDTTELIADLCRLGDQSSLTVLGRGGLPYSIKQLAQPRISTIPADIGGKPSNSMVPQP